MASKWPEEADEFQIYKNITHYYNMISVASQTIRNLDQGYQTIQEARDD
jgi:hypothetical protein